MLEWKHWVLDVENKKIYCGILVDWTKVDVTWDVVTFFDSRLSWHIYLGTLFLWTFSSESRTSLSPLGSWHSVFWVHDQAIDQRQWSRKNLESVQPLGETKSKVATVSSWLVWTNERVSFLPLPITWENAPRNFYFFQGPTITVCYCRRDKSKPIDSTTPPLPWLNEAHLTRRS